MCGWLSLFHAKRWTGTSSGRLSPMIDRRKLLVDRDALMNANQEDVAVGCVTAFDAMQKFPKATQLLSLACAFLLTCASAGVPAQDVFTAGKNLMADPLTSSGLGLRFQAMRYHLDTEVLEGKDAPNKRGR